MVIHDIRPEVRKAIEDSIGDVLGDYELESYYIQPREDASGDEAIFVDLNYRLNRKPFDSALTSKIRSLVIDRLHDLGEFRFAYLRHNLHREQKFEE